MKKFVASIVVMLSLAFAFATPSAVAQVYPYTSPTYHPNAVLPAFAVASNVPATAMKLNGIGTITLQLSGTCTNLVGTMQATTDDTNYVTINMYPATAPAAASAVASVTTTGAYSANVAGYSNVRMNNTGVTGTACLGKMVGTPVPFTLPR